MIDSTRFNELRPTASDSHCRDASRTPSQLKRGDSGCGQFRVLSARKTVDCVALRETESCNVLSQGL